MGMSMGMGLRLRLSTALSLRHSLEMKLGTVLVMRPELRLSLKVYKERENICTKLYSQALKQGNVREYQRHGMAFEFALVSRKDVPESIKKQCGRAFSHCLFSGWDMMLGRREYALSKGSWLLFVIYDMYPEMPEKVVEYAAVHERGEMITLGNHNLACKLEFAIAAKEKRIRWYMGWIEEHCPVQFAEAFSYDTHLELPDSDELQRLLEVFQSSEKACYVRSMIEEFEWPYSVLQRLSKYKEVNSKIGGIITRVLGEGSFNLDSANFTIKNLLAEAEKVVSRCLEEIRQRGFKRYVSLPRINALWRDQLTALDTIFIETLNRKRQIMSQRDYLQEHAEVGFVNSLPREGKLSRNFSEVLPFI